MLRKTLRRLIKFGRLTVIRPDGTELQFGGVQAAEPWPDVAVRLTGALTSWKLALYPDLYFGELYMDGALILERGTLWDLLELLGRNLAEQRRLPGNSAIGPLRTVLRRLRQSNSRRAARRHVAHHYDLSHQHYRQFLDTDLQYSCAYFADAPCRLFQKPGPPLASPWVNAWRNASASSLDAHGCLAWTTPSRLKITATYGKPNLVGG
jgi:cyclopropane-fatty-acyl-phospholipid synthase